MTSKHVEIIVSETIGYPDYNKALTHTSGGCKMICRHSDGHAFSGDTGLKIDINPELPRN
eukprot:scaffold192580_cov15-Prasinocladus_malaysianus.AAC.1